MIRCCRSLWIYGPTRATESYPHAGAADPSGLPALESWPEVLSDAIGGGGPAGIADPPSLCMATRPSTAPGPSDPDLMRDLRGRWIGRLWGCRSRHKCWSATTRIARSGRYAKLCTLRSLTKMWALLTRYLVEGGFGTTPPRYPQLVDNAERPAGMAA
jgi:hypothetical protein